MIFKTCGEYLQWIDLSPRIYPLNGLIHTQIRSFGMLLQAYKQINLDLWNIQRSVHGLVWVTYPGDRQDYHDIDTDFLEHVNNQVIRFNK